MDVSVRRVIPKDHLTGRIRVVMDAVLARLDSEFAAMYARMGRPSAPRVVGHGITTVSNAETSARRDVALLRNAPSG